MQLLRRLIECTQEWVSAGARERTAMVARPELAHSLRSNLLSGLRKPHMLELARLWGYKSDIWARTGTGEAGAAAAVAEVGSGAARPARPEHQDREGVAASADRQPTAEAGMGRGPPGEGRTEKDKAGEAAEGRAAGPLEGSEGPPKRARQGEQRAHEQPAPAAAGPSSRSNSAAIGALDITDSSAVKGFCTEVLRPLAQRAGAAAAGAEAREALRCYGGNYMTENAIHGIQEMVLLLDGLVEKSQTQLEDVRTRRALLQLPPSTVPATVVPTRPSSACSPPSARSTTSNRSSRM